MFSRKTQALLASLALFLLSAAPMQGQTLAELAKKAKERRGQVKPRIRVLLNADVAKFQNGALTTGVLVKKTSAVTLLKPVQATPLASTPPAPGEVVKNEIYWRARYQQFSNNVTALENTSVLAQLDLNELRNRFYREQGGFYRETIMKDIVAKRTEIETTAKQLETARKALERFQEEARQARVPPGWIR